MHLHTHARTCTHMHIHTHTQLYHCTTQEEDHVRIKSAKVQECAVAFPCRLLFDDFEEYDTVDDCKQVRDALVSALCKY